MFGGVDRQCVFNSVGFARECVKPVKLIVRDRSESAFVTVSKCGSKALIRATSSPHCSSPACQMKMEGACACANILGFFSNVLTNLRIWNTLGSSIEMVWLVDFCSYLCSGLILLTSHFNPSVLLHADKMLLSLAQVFAKVCPSCEARASAPTLRWVPCLPSRWKMLVHLSSTDTKMDEVWCVEVRHKQFPLFSGSGVTSWRQ